MAFDAAFSQRGNACLIAVAAAGGGVAPIPVTPNASLGAAGPNENRNYRFKWNGTADLYFVYDNSLKPDGTALPTPTLTTVPTATATGLQFSGQSMLPGTVEVFTLPSRLRVVPYSSAVGTLEIVPGDGL